MRILATILTLAMLAGAAGAINYDIVRQVSNDGPTNFVGVELSGTDPAVFDQPKMAKDGVDGNAPMLTSSQTAFLAEGTEMMPACRGRKCSSWAAWWVMSGTMEYSSHLLNWLRS